MQIQIHLLLKELIGKVIWEEIRVILNSLSQYLMKEWLNMIWKKEVMQLKYPSYFPSPLIYILVFYMFIYLLKVKIKWEKKFKLMKQFLKKIILLMYISNVKDEQKKFGLAASNMLTWIWILLLQIYPPNQQLGWSRCAL